MQSAARTIFIHELRYMKKDTNELAQRTGKFVDAS